MAPIGRDIFINCPFDRDYQILFQAIIFVVLRSGFRPRCALELDDSSENRWEKICNIVSQCHYGVHDISRTELDRKSRLPRFNMPLELGIFLAAKQFGPRQGSKRCVVFDSEPYRYQQFISDIAGQDIHFHLKKPGRLISELGAWLRDQTRDPKVPGGRKIAREFARFLVDLPAICARRSLETKELTFGDLAELTAEYIAARAQLRARSRRNRTG